MPVNVVSISWALRNGFLLCCFSINMHITLLKHIFHSQEWSFMPRNSQTRCPQLEFRFVVKNVLSAPTNSDNCSTSFLVHDASGHWRLLLLLRMSVWTSKYPRKLWTFQSNFYNSSLFLSKAARHNNKQNIANSSHRDSQRHSCFIHVEVLFISAHPPSTPLIVIKQDNCVFKKTLPLRFHIWTTICHHGLGWVSGNQQNII